MKHAATLFTNIGTLALPHADARGNAPVEVLEDAQILVEDGVVRAVGTTGNLHPQGPSQCIDLDGRAVIPGLVDSHTHVVFAGQRVDEMARRARGESYEQIAEAGGGIANTVEALATSDEEELATQAVARLARMLAKGTTTAEVKTGYGLTLDNERKHLRAVARTASASPVSVLPTLLAHIVPKSARDAREAHVAAFCEQLIPEVASDRLVRFVDIFVENGAFSVAEAKRIAAAAAAHDLRVKLHVDQLRDGQGAALAAEVRALSADHLEYTSEAGRRALADAGVVATILPGCAMFLGKGPWPDGRGLRESGCEVAVATDCNPGSSNVSDLLLCATLAVTRCGLTMEEALWGVTRGGAKALGLNDRGRLAVGERADFVVLDNPDWRAAFYQPGDPPIHAVAIAGHWAVRPAQGTFRASPRGH